MTTKAYVLAQESSAAEEKERRRPGSVLFFLQINNCVEWPKISNSNNLPGNHWFVHDHFSPSWPIGIGILKSKKEKREEMFDSGDCLHAHANYHFTLFCINPCALSLSCPFGWSRWLRGKGILRPMPLWRALSSLFEKKISTHNFLERRNWKL